jgi:HD superfamily phosphohydrolase
LNIETEKGWPKIIYDALYRIIPFENTECDRLLFSLINTPEFQRLRRIKQLGLNELVFPGANHTRFSHSLGVMHIARKFLNRVEQINGSRLDEGIRILVLTAALLHDLGHGPFSHVFERATGENHEERTCEIIKNPDTGIYRVLARFNPELPNLVAGFLEGKTQVSGKGMEIPPYFRQIISSQMDADRTDYLLRDSLATGVSYGAFDFEWLINHLYLNLEKNHFYVSYKAMAAAEAYIFARYHMYRYIYFHKTTRAAEVMLQLLLQRFLSLAEDATQSEELLRVIPDAPLTVVNAFLGKARPDLEHYLAMDDSTILEFVKACQKGRDRTLHILGEGIIERRLFKSIDASKQEHQSIIFIETARERARELGLDPLYMVALDTPSDTPYQPYDPNQAPVGVHIYIEDENGVEYEISAVSAAIRALKKYDLVRYYCYPEFREELKKIARSFE